MDNLDFELLKKFHRENRDDFDDEFSIRIHRALSWIERAEKEKNDNDASFIFYWIAFNAAYSEKINPSKFKNQRGSFSDYFQLLIDCDNDKIIYETIWKQFPNSIRILLENQYIYEPYWAFVNGDDNQNDWEKKFDLSKTLILKSLSRKDTSKILLILFDRLYTLRNQILHGAATWNSNVNRSQINDGSNILSSLVPQFIFIMMKNHNKNWGSLAYPIHKD